MKNKLLKRGLAAFGFGVLCGLLWLLGQVASDTTFAALPAVSAGSTLNLLTNGCLFAQNADSAGTRNWHPLADCASVTPPNASSNWTLVTDGSAVKGDQANSVTLVNNTGGNAHVEALLKATPAAPYTKTLTIRITGFSQTTGNASCGVVWTNGTSTSSALQWMRLQANTNGPTLQVLHATNFALAGTMGDQTYLGTLGLDGGVITITMQDDNSNRILFVSSTGQSNLQAYTTVRTSPFTPTNYGVACAGGASTDKFALTVIGEQ